MPHIRSLTIIAFLLAALFHSPLMGQEWKVRKEKNGITVMTGSVAGKKIDQYRAMTTIAASPETIYGEILDFSNYRAWMEDIKILEVIDSKEDEYFVYYLVYKVPWPFDDRDLVAKASVIKGLDSDTVIIRSEAVNGMIEIKDKEVRIEDFWQQWTLIPLNEDSTLVITEGFNDPAGSIPSWLINWGSVGAPLSTLENLKTRAESINSRSAGQ